MTKVEAIEKSINMWKYIKDNKVKYKDQYFNSSNIYIENGCYLCAYVTELQRKMQVDDRYCEKYCINWNKYDTEELCNCMDKSSPYRDYHIDDKCAFEIADDMLKVLIREYYKELNKGE